MDLSLAERAWPIAFYPFSYPVQRSRDTLHDHDDQIFNCRPVFSISSGVQATHPDDRGTRLFLYLNDKVIIEFIFNEPLETIDRPVDFFRFSAGVSFTDWPEESYIINRLFDGNELLSFDTGFRLLQPTYKDQDSTFHGIVIDFDRVLNGSFYGIYEIDPVFINPTEYSNLFLPVPEIWTGTAVTPNSFYRGPYGIVLSCRIVPAPFSDNVESTAQGVSCPDD